MLVIDIHLRSENMDEWFLRKKISEYEIMSKKL